jgi:hypothetical protein
VLASAIGENGDIAGADYIHGKQHAYVITAARFRLPAAV